MSQRTGINMIKKEALPNLPPTGGEIKERNLLK
jgi:hypothetical protein